MTSWKLRARCMRAAAGRAMWTNGVHVPAFAEIVIEGRILPNVREPEGPFGEFPKYYSAREAREVIEVDPRATHRRDPIFIRSCPAEMEHLLLGAIPREATTARASASAAYPAVKDGVHLSRRRRVPLSPVGAVRQEA